MRYLCIILMLSISSLLFGQNSNHVSVQINSQFLDSIPKFVIKLKETEYILDSIPSSLNPNWIKKIEVLKSEEEQKIYGNKNGIVVIYPKKRYHKRIRRLLKSIAKRQINKE